jgi:hypothetical protein
MDGSHTARANLLLTNLMALLRPIRIKKREPKGRRVMYTAEQFGSGLPRVRLLKDAVFRGIREIEHGEHLAAKETFCTPPIFASALPPFLPVLRA